MERERWVYPAAALVTQLPPWAAARAAVVLQAPSAALKAVAACQAAAAAGLAFQVVAQVHAQLVALKKRGLGGQRSGGNEAAAEGAQRNHT